MNKKKIFFNSFEALSNELDIYERPFICVWDTDTISFSMENVENLKSIIKNGCLAFIAVGENSELLHDLVDECIEIINVLEIGQDKFFLDTRWINDNSPKIYNKHKSLLENALIEANDTMWDEIDKKCNYIYVLTQKLLKGK